MPQFHVKKINKLFQDVITKYHAFMKCFRELNQKNSKNIWQENEKKTLGFGTDII